jgi:GABA permease
VLGLWPGRDLDFSNLTAHGGFFPNGVGALFSGIVIVIFSMVGAEIATIAAAESDEPERGIVKATNSVVFRISVFFVGSIFLIATILPWNSTRLGGSPYVAAMEEMGIPAAAEIMNAVVLTAVLSCLNSGLYTASRMLFVLAARREAPGRMLRISKRGVPAWAILSSSVIGFLCVVAAYVSPDTVFLFLLNSSGAIILFVYLLIALSQLRMRPTIPPERLRVKMWFYPVLTLLTAAAILAILVQMFVESDTRSQILLSLLAWALVLVAYVVRRKAIGDAHLTEQGTTAEGRADRWMHEHGAVVDVEVDAAVGEGRLDPRVIRRMDEEGYPTEGP